MTRTRKYKLKEFRRKSRKVKTRRKYKKRAKKQTRKHPRRRKRQTMGGSGLFPGSGMVAAHAKWRANLERKNEKEESKKAYDKYRNWAGKRLQARRAREAVSYTHLTLPTKA